MKLLQKLKGFFVKISNTKNRLTLGKASQDLNARLDRLERNYIILLKRILEIDGVQLMSKSSAFSNKVLRTPNDELNKGLNEPEPTIH